MSAPSPTTEIFEKLGELYLGRDLDPGTGRPSDRPTLYDARDLVTHAVCVGMTGSGKTGLCVSLLEEAAIDGIPAILIDPKGDLGNLLLTFPELRPEDLRPWVNEDDAARAGISADELAAREATRWRDGLAEWGQSPERIRKLRDAAEFVIYTPGGTAGVPLSIVKSFRAPGTQVLGEPDMLQERISTTVSSLLGLVGVDADPVQSREHILLSSILVEAWRAGRDVDLPGLIAAVMRPPFSKVGVLDVELFFPERDRMKLSFALNNLVASPSFAAWMEGEPLDVDRMLYTESGRPRVAIVSIAHLGDAERMFFVSLLLNEVLGWVRAQSGTTNLRALLYMDEIFGYLPPVANPPSKRPLLTLMKQARAFGVGVVLATQNPVDLDYKALSNAGTWFIGRLQTAQDKARLLDALDGASSTAGGSFDRQAADDILSGLAKRVFLLHNVHEPRPSVFHTRWALSYLRGPLNRDDIRALMAPRKAAGTTGHPPEPARQLPLSDAIAAAPANAPDGPASHPPVLDPSVIQRFATVQLPAGEIRRLEYRPALLGTATVSFTDKRTGGMTERPARYLAVLGGGADPVDWSRWIPTDLTRDALEADPDPRATFAALPPQAGRKQSYAAWLTAFADRAYRTERITLWKSPNTGETSRPGEDQRSFRIRVTDALRARRDAEVDRLRGSYEARLGRLATQIAESGARVERERAQASAARLDTGATFGVSMMGALLGGRRSASSAALRVMRKASRAREQSADVEQARQRRDRLVAEHDALAAELEREILAIRAKPEEAFDEVELAPRRSDVLNAALTLVWLPVAVQPDGSSALACRIR